MAERRDPSLIPLSHDHHHGLVRVFEIRQALRRDEDLLAQIDRTLGFHRDDLTPHFRAEEEAVIPALLAATADAATAAALDRLAGEHRRLNEMVAALAEHTEGDSPDAPASVAEALAAFADLLESHIRFEERELFPIYQAHVAADARSQVEATVRRILNRPDDTARTCKLPAE